MSRKRCFCGTKLVSFERNDKLVKDSSDFGFNDVIYAFAYCDENIYFMLHRKHIPIEEYKNSTQKDEYEYFYKKDDELKGDNQGSFEYCNDFIICKIIRDRDST